MFIKAACGCVVIPTDIKHTLVDHVNCICVKACDGCGYDDWGFEVRSFGRNKINYDQNHEYVEGFVPRHLTAKETLDVIRKLSRLIGVANRTKELVNLAGAIYKRVNEENELTF